SRTRGALKPPSREPRPQGAASSGRITTHRHEEIRMIRKTFRLAIGVAAIALLPGLAHAQDKLRVGLMLPYSGTYAQLGEAIENGFRLYVEEHGGKLGGREIEYFKVDDESAPPKAADNMNKPVKRDNVDVVIGTVHSGVAMGMARIAKQTGTLMIDPNSGADAVT